MTIIEAINGIDLLKSNTYSKEQKILWLSILDGIIKKKIIDTHEGAEAVTFDGYTEDTSDETVLLVEAPFEDIYIKWLEAQIDYANGEYGKYNNSVSMYNTAYSEYERFYNRTHMPISHNFKFN